MTTKTCKSCRWWEPYGKKEGDNYYGLGHCDIAWGEENDKIYSEHAYIDGTGPDFGCIHWQQKEFPMSGV